jgi:NAD(P)-dependent dehydrogenase (short-subunit alcohol dehydrogenase family)
MPGKFGATSTTEEVLSGVDLSGKRVLVTGVSAGLGVETARVVATHGAAVVGTARDLAKARGALAPHADLEISVVECDLASLASIRRCADRLRADYDGFDVLIANAGVMNCPLGYTEDGFETHFGTNHLGHFVLVNRLLPLVRDGGRVAILSSSAHAAGDVDLNDPNFKHIAYDAFGAYGRSKTANILFAVELDRRLKSRNIRVTALHPGGIMTELLRHTSPDMLQEMTVRSARDTDPTSSELPAVKTVEQGAATTVWAAFVAPADEIGGRYCEDCRVATGNGVRPFALDPQRAKALWTKSEEMVGESFTEGPAPR